MRTMKTYVTTMFGMMYIFFFYTNSSQKSYFALTDGGGQRRRDAFAKGYFAAALLSQGQLPHTHAMLCALAARLPAAQGGLSMRRALRLGAAAASSALLVSAGGPADPTADPLTSVSLRGSLAVPAGRIQRERLIIARGFLPMHMAAMCTCYAAGVRAGTQYSEPGVGEEWLKALGISTARSVGTSFFFFFFFFFC
jgi:hypothetical protein